jgi:hypothetical protein
VLYGPLSLLYRLWHDPTDPHEGDSMNKLYKRSLSQITSTTYGSLLSTLMDSVANPAAAARKVVTASLTACSLLLELQINSEPSRQSRILAEVSRARFRLGKNLQTTPEQAVGSPAWLYNRGLGYNDICPSFADHRHDQREKGQSRDGGHSHLVVS